MASPKPSAEAIRLAGSLWQASTTKIALALDAFAEERCAQERERCARLFDDDADEYAARAKRAMDDDLMVLAKMHLSQEHECRLEAERIRALGTNQGGERG